MNRLFLLIGLVSAIILPFIHFRYTVLLDGVAIDSENFFTPIDTSSGTSLDADSQGVINANWYGYLIWVYGLVAGLMCLRLIIQTVKVLWIRSKAREITWNGSKVMLHPDVETPFVFVNRIFLNKLDYQKREGAAMLIHEQTHLKQYHWIDVFLCELFIAFQWFNPLAWYYGKDVKQNLEFLADRGVLNAGFKMENYLQTIICETMGAEATVLANHFRISQNKRRLKMMKIVRTSKWKQLKLLLLMPILGFTLWAFSEPEYKFSNNEVEQANDLISIRKSARKTFKVHGIVLSGVDTTLVEDPETQEKLPKVVGAGLPGASIIIKGTTTGTVAEEYGHFSLDVAKGDVLVVSFVGFATKEVLVGESDRIEVMMREQSYLLKPGVFRNKYKGKLAPPPPPLNNGNEKMLPPPPPPPPVNGKPEFYVVETMPEYNGGMERYFASLYTLAAQIGKEKDLSGSVKVEFIVDVKGQPIQVKALEHQESPEAIEAIRIVRKLDEWNPGKQRGKAVCCNLVVPVEF